MKQTSEFIKESLDAVSREVNKYCEWGYSPSLNETVDALIACRDKLKEQYKQQAVKELEAI